MLFLKYMNDAVSQIKARLSIEELVSQYVQLKKTGKYYKALCPFHKEKTPSFVVSPDKQMAYCFGCQKGGDIFAFLQQLEGLDFSGALKELAQRANVELSTTTPSYPKEKKEILLYIQEQACQFFERVLWNDSPGVDVLSYLHQRGMKDETIRRFRLGLAPDSFDQTYSILVKKGFSQQEVVQAGLAIARDGQSGEIYDRFRLRLMFPISDIQGRVIAFGGRILRDSDEPKYVNSPETVLYRKSEAAFGLYEAKSSLYSLKKVVLVEGYMDVLASVQAGVSNTVAVSGIALTEDHIRVLKRYADEFILCFDADDAGEKATRRAVELCQKHELEVKIVRPSQGKDPGELAVMSPELWLSNLESAVPYMMYYFDLYREFEQRGMLDRKAVSQELVPLLAGVLNRIEQDMYVKKLAGLWLVSPQIIYDEINRFFRKSKPVRSLNVFSSDTVPAKASVVSNPVPVMTDIEYVCALLLEFSDVAGSVRDVLNMVEWPETHAHFLTALLHHSNLEEVMDTLDPATFERLRIQMLWLEVYHSDWSLDQVVSEVKKTIDRLRLKQYDRKRRDLLQKMVIARQEGSPNKERELFEQYVKTFSHGTYP